MDKSVVQFTRTNPAYE